MSARYGRGPRYLVVARHWQTRHDANPRPWVLLDRARDEVVTAYATLEQAEADAEALNGWQDVG